jgi:hypothetical protein
MHQTTLLRGNSFLGGGSFLAKRIRIVNDGLTITANHVARAESAHEANTLAEMLELCLLKYL